MKNAKKLVTVALVAMFTTSLVGCTLVEKTPEGIRKSVVAKVNGEKIIRGDVDDKLKSFIESQIKPKFGANYEKNPEAAEQLLNARTQLLDGLIEQEVIEQKAKDLKVMPDEKKIEEKLKKEIDNIIKNFPNPNDYKNALKSANMTEAQLKENFKPKIIQDAVSEEISKGIKIDDAKINNYYNQNLAEFSEKPMEVRPAHILVKTEQEAKDIKKRIDAGEDFAKLAKEKGTDGTKDKGGDLGEFFDYNSQKLDKTFLMAAMALKKGEVSGPIQTQFGWHIIKSLDKKEYPIKKLDTVKEEIKDKLLKTEKENLWKKSVEEWKKAAKIEKKENNLK